jgi:hypothetical protein
MILDSNSNNISSIETLEEMSEVAVVWCIAREADEPPPSIARPPRRAGGA